MRVYLDHVSSWSTHGSRRDAKIELENICADIEFENAPDVEFVVVPDGISTRSSHAPVSPRLITFSALKKALMPCHKKEEQVSRRRSDHIRRSLIGFSPSMASKQKEDEHTRRSLIGFSSSMKTQKQKEDEHTRRSLIGFSPSMTSKQKEDEHTRRSLIGFSSSMKTQKQKEDEHTRRSLIGFSHNMQGSKEKRGHWKSSAPTMETSANTTCKVIGTRKCRCDPTQPPIATMLSLHGLLRKLFTDHAVYTMFYLKSAIFGGPDAPVLLQRLLENQFEIGLQLGQLQSVGEIRGRKVGELLTAHIKAAGNVTAAAIAYNQEQDIVTKQKFDVAKEAFFAQGNEVAAGLSSINPKVLVVRTVEDAFRHHNQQVIDLATLLLERRWNDEPIVYDRYYNHMLSIADLVFVAVR